jgi:hypothetical protein
MNVEQKKALSDYQFLIGQMRVSGHNIETLDLTDNKRVNDMNKFYNGLFTNIIE